MGLCYHPASFWKDPPISMQMHDFNRIKALVVGDVMVDRYWRGDTARISPEAPVPIVRVTGCEDRVGGAGNVAMNLASLGVQTRLIGLCGADEAGAVLGTRLRAAGSTPACRKSPDARPSPSCGC